MTNRQKREFQRDFFRKTGPNIEVFRRMFDLIPDTKFFIVDDKYRIVTFNRQNLENGNFKDEMEIVGKTCAEIFPAPFAKVYMERDREVRRTGKPIIDRAYTHAADYSTDLRIASVFPLHDRRGRLIGTATVYRTKPCDGAIPDWYDRIKGAVAFIDGHYSEKITIRRLAESSGLSQTLFSRLFKKTIQTTPIRTAVSPPPIRRAWRGRQDRGSTHHLPPLGHLEKPGAAGRVQQTGMSTFAPVA